ncbi:hypothetical protein L6164_000290 [Bauhinia variegata]|uniref:Uncharacterized protein n=1 Tax=Bauhinia variegata TaxID=167791 RepID=A0ACB9Q666_BAUVA|nr:hypothetical protein L6164_000290 [Bauhinia variegata]
MARGLILSSQTTTSSVTFLLAPLSKIPPRRCKLSFGSLLHHYHPKPCSLHMPYCIYESSSIQQPVDTSKYKEVFSRRMAMAGVKPHHRIALGVSGGSDSMALCVLSKAWKIAGLNAVSTERNGLIDGLLAIIVDHGLRAESKQEADIVCHRVSEIGIKCEIAHCDWSNGRPKQGHLQEAAREMRYQIFQKVCAEHQIGVLLIAHHADDQAELFILRLSRNSGVLGLAGMPFTSQIFSPHAHSYSQVPMNHGVLLVRPLLEFSKGDMYKICQGGNLDWVEDPTNQSPLFARNRIRMSLNNLPSSTFKSELQALISACRITRSYIDQLCHSLLGEAVVIMKHGYAVINLEILSPSKVVDVCLSKFLSVLLQFISQKQRLIRGSALKLLLDYIRIFPCKKEETNRFRSKPDVIAEMKKGVETAATFNRPIEPGQTCYFMDRFILTLKMSEEICGNGFFDFNKCDMDLGGENQGCCMASVLDNNTVPEVRHMIESDWLYLAKLSKYSSSEKCQQEEIMSANGTKQMVEKVASCLHYVTVSARIALQSLKSIPVAARRSLPVLVSPQGQLLCIPSLDFRHCPRLMVQAEFKPRVPLGGGHSSFILILWLLGPKFEMKKIAPTVPRSQQLKRFKFCNYAEPKSARQDSNSKSNNMLFNVAFLCTTVGEQSLCRYLPIQVDVAVTHFCKSCYLIL